MAKKRSVKRKSKISGTKKKMPRKPIRKNKTKIVNKKTAKRKAKVSAIPKGYNSITPYLIVNDALQAIEFYKKVFNAKQIMLMGKPGGKVGHAELKIGDAKIMLADEFLEMDARGPHAYGGSPISIHLYVAKVDSIVDKAVSAGAKLIRPVENMFYGDRTATIEDPFGYKWHVSTHIEDVSHAEMRKRAEKMYSHT